MFGQYSHSEPALIVFFTEDSHLVRKHSFQACALQACLHAVSAAIAVAMPTAEGLKAEANAAYAGNKFADAVKLYTQ